MLTTVDRDAEIQRGTRSGSEYLSSESSDIIAVLFERGTEETGAGSLVLNGFGHALPIQRSKIQCPFHRRFDWGKTYLRSACLVLKLPVDS